MIEPSSFFLTAMLALVLGALDLAILRSARARAQRRRARRAAMRRTCMITYYPGTVGSGMDGDPYLQVWEKAVAKLGKERQ